jgi:chromosome segregation ATPase
MSLEDFHSNHLIPIRQNCFDIRTELNQLLATIPENDTRTAEFESVAHTIREICLRLQSAVDGLDRATRAWTTMAKEVTNDASKLAAAAETAREEAENAKDEARKANQFRLEVQQTLDKLAATAETARSEAKHAKEKPEKRIRHDSRSSKLLII